MIDGKRIADRVLQLAKGADVSISLAESRTGTRVVAGLFLKRKQADSHDDVNGFIICSMSNRTNYSLPILITLSLRVPLGIGTSMMSPIRLPTSP